MFVFELIKSIFLGIIEGITEWLPISSTGHIILFDEFFPMTVGADVHPDFTAEFMSMFEVVIQMGAIMAVVVLFWSKLWPFSKNASREDRKNVWQTWFKVCVASIPAALVGIVLDKIIEKSTGRDIDGWLYNGTVVALMLIIYGVLFILIEKRNAKKEAKITEISQISYKYAFLLGAFQMLAIIPGTSRSGAIILGAILIGFSRPCGAEFSFFMGIPAMVGGSLIKTLGFVQFVDGENSCGVALSIPSEAWVILAVATVVAFAVSMVAIKFLMNFVKKHSFAPFGVYRIILGVVVLLCFKF
ncbi:MAG: undecaprenyl-diphosphate phosphatase [Clostridia bacterium]|nr:undecaprenyl-diphosphate phosphatase [Clostridia bacterium]